eukprot:1260851-Amphidinium_carterae.1
MQVGLPLSEFRWAIFDWCVLWRLRQRNEAEGCRSVSRCASKGGLCPNKSFKLPELSAEFQQPELLGINAAEAGTRCKQSLNMVLL